MSSREKFARRISEVMPNKATHSRVCIPFTVEAFFKFCHLSSQLLCYDVRTEGRGEVSGLLETSPGYDHEGRKAETLYLSFSFFRMKFMPGLV